jgi:hypothetical protein
MKNVHKRLSLLLVGQVEPDPLRRRAVRKSHWRHVNSAAAAPIVNADDDRILLSELHVGRNVGVSRSIIDAEVGLGALVGDLCPVDEEVIFIVHTAEHQEQRLRRIGGNRHILSIPGEAVVIRKSLVLPQFAGLEGAPCAVAER